MKKRWVILLAWGLALAALFLPAAKVYVHSQLGEETAALFPATVSVGGLALRGADCLPTDAVPELALMRLDGWLLLAGLALLVLGGAAAFVKKRGSIHAALTLTTLAAAWHRGVCAAGEQPVLVAAVSAAAGRAGVALLPAGGRRLQLLCWRC